MSPGRIPRVWHACPECHGIDAGLVGFIHHTPNCSRREFDKELGRTCAICHLSIEPGQDRAGGLPPRHLDCAVDYEAHLDEEHYA